MMVSLTGGPPLMTYRTGIFPAVGALSKFSMRILITTLLVNAVEVATLPEIAGATITSIFKSLSEMAPAQVPFVGCRNIAKALLPGFPFNLALTVTQYNVSLDTPLMV